MTGNSVDEQSIAARDFSFFGSPTDADSSDDDDDGDEEEDDMKELKEAVTGDKKKPLSRSMSASRKLRSNPGHTVLYLGHLPREFEEKDLANFLKQFGRVVHIRLARSKRTGNPKGYGFVQMAHEDTARIVADTLSGYILMGQRRLVCHVVPPEKVHRRLFFKYQPPKPAPPPNRSLEKIKTVTAKLVARERKKKALLKMAGIDYDFPGYEAGRKNESETSEKNETNKKEGDKKRKNATDEKGTKKRKDSIESTSRSRSESVDSASKKKRSSSVDSSSKKKRSDSVDSDSKKKRSDSVDSATKKKRSDSVDSASKKKKNKRESTKATDVAKETEMTTPVSSKNRSESVDSSSGKKKRSTSVDSSSGKKKRSDSVDSASKKEKKRKEKEEHDESPKVKKSRKSLESSSAEKTPNKSKKSKRRSL